MAADKKKTVAIVLAAGQGKRMNSHVQKQYLLIYKKPVIYYTLNALRNIIQYGKENGYSFQKITMNTAMVTHKVAN